jgi:ubiquinone/menaquinone biosynthesis C-methylase UbiE
MAETQYEPRRFRSTVAWYERYRLAYPDRLIARVAALAGLSPGDPVLDLGAGTGMLAVPFAQAGMAVTAMDPEPQMLAAAGEAAKAAGVSVALVQGSSYDLTPTSGPFRLVVIGRAFHWMDRSATLQMLNQIVAPEGGVAFFHDAHPGVPENDWYKTVREVGDRYGRGEAAHIRERRKGGHRRYEPFLFSSAFTLLDGLSVTQRRSISEDEIVGRAFSMSTYSPEKLGDRMDAFEVDLRTVLRTLSPEGHFMEVAELVALLARRPGSDGQEKCEATGGSEAVFPPAARPDKKS